MAEQLALGRGGRPVVCSLNGIVAAAHPLAAQAGAAILGKGGNAFDAAVAVAAALNVVEPYMSSLAGMGFATMWVAAEARVRVLDFVPPVPRSFPVERFHTREQLARGPSAVALPGNLAGWHELQSSYGRLTLEQVLAPAIVLASKGYGVAAFGVLEIAENGPTLAASPVFGAAFRDNYPFCDGVAAGDIIRQPALAATLRRIGAEGPDVFYKGAIGQQLVSHVQSLGGTLDMADLASVAAVWREPIRVPYRGLLVHVPPPPCEGFQFLLTLRILDGFDVASLGHNTLEHLDLVLRAIRLAAGVRIANGLPTAERLAELLSDSVVDSLRRELRAGGGMLGPTEQWTGPAPEGHTTSFSIADDEGNLVCITQSLGSPFGSGVVVPGTGICLNNFLYWADVQPGSPNRTAPGQLLPMCMAPSISTRDGVPELALGTPGSYGILQTQAQALVHYTDFGLPLQQAIEAPRARLWDGNKVELESRLDAAVVAGLRSLGHDASTFVLPWTMKVGGMQAIRRDASTGLLTGAADPRRDGYAIAL